MGFAWLERISNQRVPSLAGPPAARASPWPWRAERNGRLPLLPCWCIAHAIRAVRCCHGLAYGHAEVRVVGRIADRAHRFGSAALSIAAFGDSCSPQGD